jgi:hypothetical protein
MTGQPFRDIAGVKYASGPARGLALRPDWRGCGLPCGNPCCTVVVNGQAAATSRRPAKRHEETVEITPLAPLGERVTRAAVRRAQAIG